MQDAEGVVGSSLPYRTLLPPAALVRYRAFAQWAGAAVALLGLATVFDIAKQHGGYLEVESAPGQGTGRGGRHLRWPNA